MKKCIRVSLIILSFSLLNCRALSSHLDIAPIYLSSLQELTPVGQETSATTFSPDKISEQQCRLLSFKILSQDPLTCQPGASLDNQAWENLELYDGANLLKRLHTCSLKLGEAAFGGMLGQPITSIPELTRRQTIIQAFLQHHDIRSSTQQIMLSLGALEPWTLALWKDEDNFFKESFGRLYFPAFLHGSSFMNSSPTLLELFRRSEDLGTFLLVPFALLYIRYLIKNGTYNNFSQSLKNMYAYINNDASLPEQPSAYDLWFSVFFSGSEAAFSLLNVPIATYQVTQYYQSTHQNLEFLHRKVLHVAQFIEDAKSLYKLLKHHRSLLSTFHEVDPLFDFFEKPSAPLRQFMNISKSKTFKKPFSYNAHFGRILVAYKLLDRIKHELIPLLIALGKLDAYLSWAHLLSESQNKPIRFCFARYTTHERPFISLTNFWNPLITTAHPVANSLELGHPHARGVILTGQNTGGKSTILKGIALNILLAQTFGIAPAQSATITPFDYLSTYMNITDNAQEGLSLFAAEVKRAKELLETISTLSSHKKSFVVIDEAFKGTGGEAEGLSYWYAQQLARFPHCMCINATHYPKLTKLERETKGTYHNYKVEVRIDPNGKLIRPYKLERGFTLINIAEHILIEQGLKR